MGEVSLNDLARILRSLTLEARRITVNRKYPRTIDIDKNNALMLTYTEAIDDLCLDSQGASLRVERWFDKHWHIFPFADEWETLTHVEQRFVEYSHKLCQQMTIARN